jgi:hypothetical protein
MMAGALPEMILRDDELEDFLFMIYFLLYGSAFRCSVGKKLGTIVILPDYKYGSAP